MFKKISRYLLLQYPLLWNTKIFHVSVAIILTHICFYLAGILYFDSYQKLHSYSYIGNTDMVGSSNIVFSILVSALTLIIWLVFYLRNNPFKSYYPLPKGYFVAQFSIMFVVILAGIMFYHSFAEGFWDTVEKRTADVELVEESNTLNLSYGLIPVYASRYNTHNCCDSLAYLDSLQHLSYDTSITEEHREVLTKVMQDFHKLSEDDENYSYMNFCYKFYDPYSDKTVSKEEIAAKLQRMLIDKDRKTITAILSRFDSMCRRYEIKSNISIMSYVDKSLSAVNYRPKDFIQEDYYGTESRRDFSYHHDFDDVSSVLDNIERARGRKFDADFWLVNLYIALFMALALFSFRLSSTRTWLIALVAGGVMLIIITLLSTVLYRDVSAVAMFLFFILLFYVMYFVFRKGGLKVTSAIVLHWFTWTLPLAGIFLYVILCDIYRPITMVDPLTNKEFTPPAPFYDFLRNNDSELALLNFVLVFIYAAFVISRNYRHWMGMAEE